MFDLTRRTALAGAAVLLPLAATRAATQPTFEAIEARWDEPDIDAAKAEVRQTEKQYKEDVDEFISSLDPTFRAQELAFASAQIAGNVTGTHDVSAQVLDEAGNPGRADAGVYVENFSAADGAGDGDGLLLAPALL